MWCVHKHFLSVVKNQLINTTVVLLHHFQKLPSIHHLFCLFRVLHLRPPCHLTTTHNHIRTFKDILGSPVHLTLCVFGLWEEDRVPGGNPQGEHANSEIKPRTFSPNHCTTGLHYYKAYLVNYCIFVLYLIILNEKGSNPSILLSQLCWNWGCEVQYSSCCVLQLVQLKLIKYSVSVLSTGYHNPNPVLLNILRTSGISGTTESPEH